MSHQRDAVCHPEFREDLQHWIQTDRRTAQRLLDLMRAVLRDPFTGIGKPEPLKYSAQASGPGVSPRSTAAFIWLRQTEWNFSRAAIITETPTVSVQGL